MKKKQKNIPLFARILPSFFDEDVKKVKQEGQTLKEKALREAQLEFKQKIKLDIEPNKRYGFWPNPIQWYQYRQTTKDITKRLWVEMQLENGDLDHFYVSINHGAFFYNDGKYTIKESYYKYSKSVKAYVGHYHEGFALPVKYNIPVDHLRKAVKDSEPDIIYTTDPKLLHKFTASRLIEMLLDNGSLEKWVMYCFYGICGLAVLGFINVAVGMAKFFI